MEPTQIPEEFEKPKVIQAIEKLLDIEFQEPRVRPDNDILGHVMPFSNKGPKYAWDEEKLIGLNLANSNLSNEKWKEILGIIEPENLQVLNLSKNELTEFHLPRIMEHLKELNLSENPLTFPPEEIMQQDNAAILRYLKEALNQGIRDVYEVKMLILGEGETGKTTFWNKLQDINYPVPLPIEDQPSTVGIEIKEGWDFEHLNLKGVQFLANLWDFGGQPIQHMTHQFFLTRRSFYVLLADGRRNVANFSYWFKIINLLGVDPAEENPIPVLILLNKKGSANIKLPYDAEEVSKHYSKLKLITYEVDFAKDPEKDFQLRNLPAFIQDILCNQLLHLPLPMPTLWDDVRDELRRLKEEEKKDHIRFTDFEKICKDKGITEKASMWDLSRHLHDLGVILHHQDDIRLKNFIILNPVWAINGVYEILKHDKVKQNQGRFSQRLLTRIWNECDYDVDEQQHLLNLMLKDSFEVCFHAEEKSSKILIAPQLLPEFRPKFEWKPGRELLQYTYQYPFMPKGLIGRLMVRLHEYLQSRDRLKVVWEKGMLLENENIYALVEETEAETGGKIIRIRVAGPGPEKRRFFLQTIQKELKTIHERSFTNLKFFEQIPCCCSECFGAESPQFYKREDLEKRKEKRKTTIECNQSFEKVEVKALMDGVFEREGTSDMEKEMPEQRSTSGPFKVFFSYSRKDKAYLDNLKKHLSPLHRDNLIQGWDDSMILPGEEWDAKIKEELTEADIILVLLSADLISTDYVWNVELPKAIERHKRNEARVIPIFVRPCRWQSMELAQNNGLPSKGAYISKAEDEDEAWLEVVEGIEKVIIDLRKQQQA